ncbi:MAG: Veg family protein [Fastidiosipilaceae bacterium]|jgi:uncharacterized protein Veg
MIVKADLEKCRKDMQACLGRRVRLRSSGGRKRTIVREGILENCYPNVFTVRCARDNDNSELVSYSYVDILTQSVEVAVEADESLAVLADQGVEPEADPQSDESVATDQVDNLSDRSSRADSVDGAPA